MKGKPTTKAQRARLLEVYLERGFQAAKPLAIEYGFDPGNLAQLARNAGHIQRPVVSQVRQTRNAMWARARANGALVR
jgi:hypothetical protein